jgi:DNA-binding MarR family transcriptional regulator
MARPRLKKLGLTSARFDLLFALTDEGQKRAAAIHQSVLRRALGVTRPTVSRMLHSLEDLGLVRRRRSDLDRRQVEVELTADGWSRIRVAYGRMTLSEWAMTAVDAAMRGESAAGPNWDRVPPMLFDEMDALEEVLKSLRAGFGDFATLAYRWFPEGD